MYVKRTALLMLAVIMIICGCVHPMEAGQTDWQIVKELTKGYNKPIKLINGNTISFKKYEKIVLHRKNKNYIVVEKVVSKSTGKPDLYHGWYNTTEGDRFIIGYNKKVPKGKKVVSYIIYDFDSNEPDEILWVVDNKRYR